MKFAIFLSALVWSSFSSASTIAGSYQVNSWSSVPAQMSLKQSNHQARVQIKAAGVCTPTFGFGQLSPYSTAQEAYYDLPVLNRCDALKATASCSK